MSNLLRRAVHAAPWLALAASLAGCAPQGDVLARIDGETITIAEFNEVARSTAAQYPDSPDTARTRLLNDLVQRELLVQGAHHERLHATPEFEAFSASLERQMLREALYRNLIGGPYPVSEAEVRAVYERRNEATRTNVIFCFTQDVARRVLAELGRGEDFAAVADRYNPTGMVPPGGALGLLQPGGLLPPLDEVVRTGPIGRLIGPVEVPGEGWFVLRLDERRRVEQPPYEEERARLAEMLRQRKQRVTAVRVVQNLRTLYRVEVAEGAAQAVIGQFRLDPSQGMAAPPAPGPERRDLVLATFLGGRYTLGDAHRELESGAGQRPNLDVVPSVERWIESQAIDRAAIAEAYKRRLHEEPVLRQRIRERLNNQLLDGYYRIMVIDRVQATPEDYAQAYELYKSSFTRVTAARIQSVTVHDSAAAAALAALAGQAPSLREAVATAGTGGRVREESLTFPTASPEWAGIEGTLIGMTPGQVAGPFTTPDGWLLVQLIGKQESAPAFAELPPETLAQLQNVAAEARREARLTALTDSLRRAITPVVIYAERLKRVPWPPVPAAPPGT